MIGQFASSAAFRQSLEQRMLAAYGGVRVNQARTRLASERLVLRLQERRPTGFVAKGGFALELRLADRFRGSRDLDIAAESELTAEIDALSDEIEAACEIDLSDGFELRLDGEPQILVVDGEARTLRYLVRTGLGGRLFETVPVDIRTGDSVPARFDELPGSDLLEFAGIRSPRIRVIPLEYHFAEKVHAYTRPRERQNTRIRDLVDMHALIDLGTPAGSATKAALREIFWHRKATEIPPTLPVPPGDWREGFGLLARSMPGVPEDMTTAFEKIAAFYAGFWR